MTKALIIGWLIELLGVAVWLYGYLSTGNPSIVDWRAIAPSWIADWLPNIQSEIGMTLMFAGMIPIYWPRHKVQNRAGQADALAETITSVSNDPPIARRHGSVRPGPGSE